MSTHHLEPLSLARDRPAQQLEYLGVKLRRTQFCGIDHAPLVEEKGLAVPGIGVGFGESDRAGIGPGGESQGLERLQHPLVVCVGGFLSAAEARATPDLA